MYLSKFPINVARRGARKLLGSPQAMHAAVLSSFPPEETDPGGPRVLWRVDRLGPANHLYVVSPDRPDFVHLVEQAGWPTAVGDAWQSQPYGRVLDELRTRQQWAFRLRANPTKAARDIGKRVGLLRVSEQVQWLLDRSQRAGFEVQKSADGELNLTVAQSARVVFHRQGRPVTLQVAMFEGVLEVRDPELFRATLVGGLGPAKGYGCGLMTVTRLRSW